jgi:hypothetical protein
MHTNICDFCKHKWRNDYRCDAFPGDQGIPYEVATDLHDHRFPFTGDHGVQFELDPSLARFVVEQFRKTYEDSVQVVRQQIWDREQRYASTDEVSRLLESMARVG